MFDAKINSAKWGSDLFMGCSENFIRDGQYEQEM